MIFHRLMPRGVLKIERFPEVSELMHDRIIFDRYYYINSAQTKEMMVHYILQLYTCKRLVHSYAPYGAEFSYSFSCFAWRPVTSINKCGVLRASARVNCLINTRFFFSSLIYAC